MADSNRSRSMPKWYCVASPRWSRHWPATNPGCLRLRIDGGYYTKTAENLPLAGRIGPQGSYVCGALSGFGIMAACGVGELVARLVAGLEPPGWAHWFDIRRYENPAYLDSIGSIDSGQL